LPFWASASIMILLFQPHELPGAWEPVYQLALMFFGFPMIILASLRADPQGRWGGATKWLGDISYPLYALHYPILLLVGGVAKLAHVPDIITLAVGTIVSVMAAWIAFKFYDEPVRRWLSNRLIRRPIAPASDHATVAGSVKVSVAAS
jgi:peptidoglycan/LPS O-acetylase OafA/YrhL